MGDGAGTVFGVGATATGEFVGEEVDVAQFDSANICMVDPTTEDQDPP
jgi:hypothetical protein